ncbi:HutD family protein [Amycolatopsis sp.]|jgi:environmental stress-induced protein Ves|uniref:HutD/Ves family protein n=1 Tax=Amycolatopsis sp. TaxID=37632 RepID=UPI002E0B2D4A|nr:HutD family protein [Amycolatopsis sp.]
MTISVLRWADHVPVPWKNGGGVTREVAGGFSDFGWRVSVADVSTSGPFSVFPGVDRTIMGVEGSGMVLSLDGVEREVALLALSNGVTIAGHQLGHLDAALVTGHLAVRGPVAIVRITT